MLITSDESFNTVYALFFAVQKMRANEGTLRGAAVFDRKIFDFLSKTAAPQ